MIFVCANGQYLSKNQQQKDLYSRPVFNEAGEKQNYTYEETRYAEKSATTSQSTTNLFQQQNDGGEDYIIWNYRIFGKDMGRNALLSEDIDNDGKIEIICSAVQSDWLSSGYWYIIEYNQSTQKYEITWSSQINSSQIASIVACDLNKDAVSEIYVAYKNGDINLFDGQTLDQISSFNTSSEIKEIRIGDPDNDSNAEIAVLTKNSLKLFNIDELTPEQEFPVSADNFEIGNVDDDEHFEVVYNTGKVMEYQNSQKLEEWTFHTEYSQGLIRLADIDKDQKKEIISAESWYNIVVYDADEEAIKYSIESDLDIDYLLMYDVNGDTIPEILYGDGQWGEIHFIDAVNQQEIWEIHNPEHGVMGISIADFDNNGILDVIWGAGWSSTGSDNLFVANLDSKTIGWQSLDIDGPFYTLEIGDIDNDGTNEIVTISYESGSGYDSGIISVFDAETHEIEWQSDGNLLGYAWQGIFSMDIDDIDLDNNLEIVVAAGETYTGAIRIIDGKTKEMKREKIFTGEDLDEFYVQAIGNIDNDNNKEIVVAGTDRLSIINAEDLSVEWNSGNLFGDYVKPTHVMIDSIDADEAQEIILCKRMMYIIDAQSKQIYSSVHDNYVYFDLQDVDNDGLKEIVALTSKLKLIRTIELEIQSLQTIHVTDLDKNGNEEYLLTGNGRIYFYIDDAGLTESPVYDTNLGEFDALKTVDLTGDGKDEILFGTTTGITEISSNIYACVSSAFRTVTAFPDCDANNGEISLEATGGTAPYTFTVNDSPVSGTLLTNLAPGSYNIIMTDSKGCVSDKAVQLKQAELHTDLVWTDVNCGETQNGKAIVFVNKGTAPYSFEWSNGETDSIAENLRKGDYTVTVTDAKNCTSTNFVTIEKDTLIVDLQGNDVSCYGEHNGFAEAIVQVGDYPFQYSWSNGMNGNIIYDLPAGTYILNVTDEKNCSATDSIVITQPDEIELVIETQSDNPGTTQVGEGVATVKDIIGGTSPFFVEWNDPFNQKTPTATNLIAGEYLVTVTDYLGCSTTKTVVIDSVLTSAKLFDIGEIQVYPNPATDNIFIQVPGLKSFEYSIFNANGICVLSKAELQYTSETVEIDVRQLLPGNYVLKIVSEENIYQTKIIIMR